VRFAVLGFANRCCTGLGELPPVSSISYATDVQIPFADYLQRILKVNSTLQVATKEMLRVENPPVFHQPRQDVRHEGNGRLLVQDVARQHLQKDARFRVSSKNQPFYLPRSSARACLRYAGVIQSTVVEADALR
jgi:hypothetical protein